MHAVFRGLACLALGLSVSVAGAATIGTTDFGTYVIGSGDLGPTLVDGATTTGLAGADVRANDSGNGAGPFGTVIVYENLWDIGDEVSITGLAFPVLAPGGPGDTSNNTDNGTLSFEFFDLSGGADPAVWNGTSNGETSFATKTLVFDDSGSLAGPQIASGVFDTPLTFTATTSGIAIFFNSSSSIRTRVDNTPDSNEGLQFNRFNGNQSDGGGDGTGHQWTIAGTAGAAIPEPSTALLVCLGTLAVAGRRRG